MIVRAFAVSAIATKPNSIGYRTIFAKAVNQNEAFGVVLVRLEELEPDASFSKFSALEISAASMAQIGVHVGDLTETEQP